MQNLLGSHDTERYLTLCQGQFWRMKLSVLLQMTYIGAPMIYYGDEIGMGGGKDPDNRRCMIWEEKKWDTELRNLYKDLIRIRLESPALRRGSFKTLIASNAQKIFAFERQLNAHLAYVAINRRGKPIPIELPVNPLVKEVKDVLTGQQFTAKEGVLRTIIPSHSARIFLTNIGHD